MRLRFLKQAIADGWHTLLGRKIYLVCLIVVPLAFTFFFINMMDQGVATKVPSAVVDLDHSSMSRQITRSLNANELIDVEQKVESFHEAVEQVRRGDIYGFFMIPADFQKDALAGRTPTITYYCNMTFFVPGTMMFKGFKTIAVTTSGGLVQTTLVSVGVGESEAATLLQPVVIQQQAPGNPWLNYNYYLTNSFVPGIVSLMVMLVAAFSICVEMKRGTSPQWLRRSGGSVILALFGKLLPQALVAIAVGCLTQAIMYGFCHFPMNCSAWHMVLAMMLLVVASQAFAVIICSVLPNLRFAVSICSLIGILAFSIAAFSFPVDQMYPAVGIFSYILPVRYYFLIYIDQALNGIPLFYSRFFYIALIIFPFVALTGVWKLKRHLENPVYIP